MLGSNSAALPALGTEPAARGGRKPGEGEQGCAYFDYRVAYPSVLSLAQTRPDQAAPSARNAGETASRETADAAADEASMQALLEVLLQAGEARLGGIRCRSRPSTRR